METQEEYERWLHDPERIRRRNEAERQIGRAIVFSHAIFLLGVIAVAIVVGLVWWFWR